MALGRRRFLFIYTRAIRYNTIGWGETCHKVLSGGGHAADGCGGRRQSVAYGNSQLVPLWAWIGALSILYYNMRYSQNRTRSERLCGRYIEHWPFVSDKRRTSQGRRTVVSADEGIAIPVGDPAIRMLFRLLQRYVQELAPSIPPCKHRVDDSGVR